jgi:K+-sensing histidine kinase KdpD
MLLQRNLVSMASHEFRTPLTIIDAHAQRLIRMKDRLSPEDLRERAHKIRSAVLRMTHLIRNLIDSPRLIDGDVELHFHPSVTDVGMELLPTNGSRTSSSHRHAGQPGSAAGCRTCGHPDIPSPGRGSRSP